MGLNPSTSSLMEQQQELFSTQNFTQSPLGQRKEQLVMNRQQLIEWKHRIFKHQKNVQQAPPQQKTLFDAPSPSTADDIDPFNLRLHSPQFYRMPDQGDECCLYFILDADIAKCFDRIDHKVLLQKLNTTPAIARQIRAWLKSGALDQGDWTPTNEGTPQGGVISPLLANIALDGLEEHIKQWAETWKGGKRDNRKSISLVRYADDFVVIHKDKSVIQQAKGLIENWLNGLGLELKESKTRICHTLNRTDGEEAGFDFLGWNIRQYAVGKHHSGKNTYGKLLGFKTIIKPSKESVDTHYKKIVKVLDSMRGKSQEEVIERLNPIIVGWTKYHSTVCSSKTFSNLDNKVYNKLRSWVKRRHPNKTLKWCCNRYFYRTKEKTAEGLERTDQWVFATPSKEPNNPVAGTHELRKHAWTPIVYHTKIEGTKSPFDGDWRYWSTRRGKYPGTPTRVANLMKRQKGKCARCGVYFEYEDILEVDHIVPKSEGGKDQYKNYQLLHRHCHHEKTAEDRQRQMENKGQKKARKTSRKSGRKSETKQGSAGKSSVC
jgi:RNA-directed DNA polymerase